VGGTLLTGLGNLYGAYEQFKSGLQSSNNMFMVAGDLAEDAEAELVHGARRGREIADKGDVALAQQKAAISGRNIGGGASVEALQQNMQDAIDAGVASAHYQGSMMSRSKRMGSERYLRAGKEAYSSAKSKMTGSLITTTTDFASSMAKVYS
jgi:hypothetical protein